MKKLNKILGKLLSVAADKPMGACCCRDANGIVRDCTTTSDIDCGRTYEAYLNGWNCTFYEGRPCHEACFDRPADEMPEPPSVETPNSDTVSPSAPPPFTPSQPPQNPPTSPSAPTLPPLPMTCLPSRTAWADCLDSMDVGDNPTGTTAPLDPCQKGYKES